MVTTKTGKMTPMIETDGKIKGYNSLGSKGIEI
jgi:hypothetical protein